jgi:predicted RNase H-like HicB family nuclease
MIYSKMRNIALTEDEDGGWIAESEDLPGYRATGDTKEKAIENITRALLLYYPCRCGD